MKINIQQANKNLRELQIEYKTNMQNGTDTTSVRQRIQNTQKQILSHYAKERRKSYRDY